MTTSPCTLAEALANVDGFIILNLDRSPERFESFLKNLGRHLPESKRHRLSAVVGVELPGYGEAPWFTERTGDRAKFWAGTAGCSVSHRKAIELAKSKGWKKVLILEDDVELVSPIDDYRFLREAIHAMGPKDMMYLGFNRPTPYGRILKHGTPWDLWQISGVLSTHAYIISEGLYDTVIGLLPTEQNAWEWLSRHRAIDTFYRERLSFLPHIRITALFPTLIRQRIEEPSEIGGTQSQIDYNCTEPPKPYTFTRRLSRPFRKLKVSLNSVRTNRRACKGGLPGYKKKKAES